MAQGDISGPNSRVVEVMNFLAAHPTESFTLSELAARLGLSIGSAHRLLTTLAEARYLSRHPRHKTYSLGMALVALGQAALAQHRDIDVARREMARLSSELGVQCHACAVVGDELLFLASEGTPQSYEPVNRVGDRRPYMPPLGMVHAAWADPDEQEDYIERAPAALNETVRAHIARSLEVIRRRGYAMSGTGPAFRALRHFTAAPVGHQKDEAYWAGLRQLIADLSEREMQLLDFGEAGRDGISFITVPVFSPGGRVSLELSLSGLPPQLTRSEFERHVERLRAAAAVVTGETHGREPPPVAGAIAASHVAAGMPHV
ncbi:MAG: helix-turn-helix domain-containing protein [Novosphingobium sp.]|jgi:DNA-binding IclR family transcriptional regulator|nr:helix-turn-helix domain-containing protein [Novosphingobium sp.]